MKRLALFAALCLCLAVPVAASDENLVEVKGDVVYVDILKSNGVYLETLLWVWSDAPGQDLQPIALRCDGNASGSLSSCLYPASFFGCSTSTQSWANFYEPTLVTTRTWCGASARRDAGECVRLTGKARPLDSSVYSVFADGHPKSIQALSLDVTDINFESQCNVKP